MARAMHSRCCCPPDRLGARILQAVLHLLEQAGTAQAGHHHLLEFGLGVCQTMNARAVRHVLEHRLRERVGLLEDHADARAQLHHIEVRIVDVGVVDLDLARHAAARNGVVHPVDAAQERRLAAARRPDERHDALVGHIDVDVLQGMLVAIVDVDIASNDFGGLRCAGHSTTSCVKDFCTAISIMIPSLVKLTNDARISCAARSPCRS